MLALAPPDVPGGPAFLRKYSGKKLVEYFTCYVCQAEVPTLITIGEPLMVKTQAMENCGVKGMDVDLVLLDIQA